MVLLDLLSSLQDARPSSEVDVGRGEAVERLVIAPVILLDEVADSALQISGQIVVLEQDAALQ